MTLQLFRIFWWQVARDVRRHRFLAICNVLSIALGVAVYLAIRIANESATAAFNASVDLVAGRAHLEIRGDIDEQLWPTIEKQPGVAAVTGTVETLATLPGKPGEYLRIVGVEIVSADAFRTFELRAGRQRSDPLRWMATPGGIALTSEFAARHGLQLNSQFPVLINGRQEQLAVLALIEETELPVDSRFAAMDIGWTQELLRRPGRLTSLQIRLHEPERAEEIAARLSTLTPGHTVGPPQQRSAQVGKMLAAFQLNLSALSLVSLLVGVFLVFNTVSTSVARRRVQIGIIRTLGVTPRQVRALFLGEALLYAVPGILIGMAAGVALASQLSQPVEQTISSLYTLVHVERLAFAPPQFIVAAIYGLLSALVGAWAPAAEASRVDPAQALRRSSNLAAATSRARRWWISGIASAIVAVLAAHIALHWRIRPLAFASAFCVLVSAALFAPLVLKCVEQFGRAVPSFPPAVTLALRKLRRGLRRNAITVGALGAAVAMFVALATMVHSFRRSLDAWIGKGIIADLFIAPAANEHLGMNSFLPDDAIEWLRRHPDVAGADSFRELPTTIYLSDGPHQTLLAIVDGEYRHNLTFLQGDETTATQRVFAGEAVLASEPFARRFGLRSGDTVRLESSRGPVAIQVAGVYADYSRDQGYLLMSSRLFSRLRDDPRAMSAAVYLKPGANAAALEDAFRAAFPGEWAINSSRTLRERILRIFDQTFAVTLVLRSVAIVVAITGVVLTMLTLVFERRRELALTRALGASRAFVSRLVMTEAGLLGLSSAALGLAAGLPLAMVLTWVVNPVFFGWTIQLHLPWPALLTMPLWITAAALLAAWWPACVARRGGIAESLHEE